MKQDTVALAYARALFELADEKGELEGVHEEVLAIQDLHLRDESIRLFFESPRIDRREKAKIIDAAFRGKISDLLLDFLLLVVRKGRQQFLKPMLDAFKVLRDKRIGLVHATAFSAVPLSDDSWGALVRTLGEKLSRKIALENVVRAEVLGGLIVRYDGMVADGSLATALRKIRSNMLSPKFGSELIHEDQR